MAGVFAVGMLMSMGAIGASAGSTINTSSFAGYKEGTHSTIIWYFNPYGGYITLTNDTGTAKAAQVSVTLYDANGNDIANNGNSTNSLAAGGNISTSNIGRNNTVKIKAKAYICRNIIKLCTCCRKLDYKLSTII